MGRAGICEPAGSILVTAGRNVCVLFEGSLAATCDDQSDFRGDDALHADCHTLYGFHVCLAWSDALVADLPLRRLRVVVGPKVR